MFTRSYNWFAWYPVRLTLSKKLVFFKTIIRVDCDHYHNEWSEYYQIVKPLQDIDFKDIQENDYVVNMHDLGYSRHGFVYAKIPKKDKETSDVLIVARLGGKSSTWNHPTDPELESICLVK